MDVHIVIDGIDEVDSSQHRELIKSLIHLAEAQKNCKMVFSSQNIPSINSVLKGKPALFLGAQSSSVAQDLKIIVKESLEEISDNHGGIPDAILTEVRQSILKRAEGW